MCAGRAIVFVCVLAAACVSAGAQDTRVYIAQDDHTDLFWSGTEAEYELAIPDTLDQQLDLIDATIGNPPAFQNRWNCDGSWWAWLYERDRSPAEFQRFMDRVASGHISVPLNALCVTPGGAPAEAVLRGMYYPGQLERRFGVRFDLAYLIENQSHPMGIHSLWAGSGAKYSWKGVCGCATLVPQVWDREHEIYNALGADGTGVAMKWHSAITTNEGIGGYAEARDPLGVVDFVTNQAPFNGFGDRYPYSVIGAFGHGWDDFQTPSDDDFVQAAMAKSDATRGVIVSNESDFFEDFDDTYGLASLPAVAQSHGNEWDLHCASLAEVTARVKRSIEKLRAGEALATIASLHDPAFMDGRAAARDRAWMSLGLYWEHDFGMDGFPPGDPRVAERIAWQRRLAGDVEAYVDALHADAAAAVGALIDGRGVGSRYAVFNPMSWVRDDIADLPLPGAGPVHVVDTTTGDEVPSEFVLANGEQRVRILASGVPSVGYRVYEVRAGGGQGFGPAATIVDGGGGALVVISDAYGLRVEPRGAISGLAALRAGGVDFAGVDGGRMINDLGSGTASGTLTVEHSGAVSATVIAESADPVAHAARITVFRGIDRVEVHNEITQNFDEVLSWAFPFALSAPSVRHEELGAVLDARLVSAGGDYADRNARYDWLTLNHFAMMSGGSGRGVYLSNADCSFFRIGHSTASELDTTTPSLSVLAGGKVAHGGGGLPAQGGDAHFTQRFALRATASPAQADAMRFALEHQNPLVAIPVSGDGPLPAASYSFLQVSNPGVLLWALKPHDDGPEHGVVARLWNMNNESQDATISLRRPIVTADAITHIETALESVPVSSGTLDVHFARQQMRSMLIAVACPGDLNGDGLANLADVAAFIDAFVAGDPLADFNGDGVLNFADVTGLIGAFVVGC